MWQCPLERLEYLALCPGFGPGHRSMRANMRHRPFAFEAHCHQQRCSRSAGATNASTAMHQQRVAAHDAAMQVAKQRRKRVDRWSVKVGDRKPHHALWCLILQPLDIVGIADLEFGALIQAHNRGSTNVLHRNLSIGANEMFAAQPQRALIKRQWNAVGAAMA